MANAVQSYKDLPLRLYQVSRKYRDEARPRQGLLRGREFVMKDLYTFDVTDEEARETYEAVRAAYAAFFDELHLPYIMAGADSGNMGGSLSHEYHFPSEIGEDTVIRCPSCDFTVNEEIRVAHPDQDPKVCPSCLQRSLEHHRAIEIGHTFHLGTRYSVPLDATVLDANNETTPIFMGCHGIGVTRLIGAVASLLADSKGLSWPLAIAPFGVVIVATTGSQMASAGDLCSVYDQLTATGLDAAIDDRQRSVGWRLKDADLVGYPFIVVLGSQWGSQMVELQCRRLGIKEHVHVDQLVGRLADYSAGL